MSTHNIYFRQEVRKIFSGYPLLSRAKHIEYFAYFSSVSVRHDKSTVERKTMVTQTYF